MASKGCEPRKRRLQGKCKGFKRSLQFKAWCSHLRIGIVLYPRFRGCRQWHSLTAIPMRCAGVLRWKQCLRLMLGDKRCNTAEAVDLRNEEAEHSGWGRKISSFKLNRPRSSAVAFIDNVGPIINHAVDLICRKEEGLASTPGR